ncbi:MAG: guanylate kinase [Acidobacteria bacterium]|nr:guanylate kinase [Acidobacteriota bacterium]
MKRSGNLIVVTAPSGTGKTTIIRRILAEMDGIEFSVSHTTRPARTGESHGRDYFYVDRDEFARMVEDHAFYEWAEVFGKYLYGTSRAFVDSRLAEGVDVLLDIEVQGALQIKRSVPRAVLIFLLPPSFDELQDRIARRNLDAPAEIRKRLETARKEIRLYNEFHHVIINGELESSVQAAKAVIGAARCRVPENEPLIREILNTFEEDIHV